MMTNIPGGGVKKLLPVSSFFLLPLKRKKN
jgi:hypothetical protein